MTNNMNYHDFTTIRNNRDVMTSIDNITPEMRMNIVNTVVYPQIIKEIKDIMIWKYRWRKIGNISYTMSKLFIIIGTIFAFTETHYKLDWLALTSGCISLFGVFLIQFGDFAQKESKSRTDNANKILEKLNINIDVNDTVIPNVQRRINPIPVENYQGISNNNNDPIF